MPSKKRKYNARFPAGRIKRIMQADEEVGKIAQAVPIIISRTLELFVESLLTKSSQITMSRNAKTLSPTHLKQCIMSESRFDFLKDLVKNIPDISMDENGGNGSDEHHGTTNNGLESNNGANHHRIAYQRSQSLQQPSTSSSQQYNISPSSNRVQSKQFYLNNYTSIPTNNNNNLSSNQITKPNISTSAGAEFQHPPTKIFRLNSTPATATITSSSEQQQQNVKKQSLAPLEFPIQFSFNIDGKNNALSTESPAVKIDYSKLALPATSPSIKIDLSHFNAQIASTSNASHQPSSNATTMPTSSSASLDEDYDA